MAFEMRFRVWDSIKKEFVYKGFSISYNGNLLQNGQEVPNPSQYSVHFFTGLLDKYNKEIYEEDIVEHMIAEKGNLKQSVGIVKYDSQKARFVLMDSDPQPLGDLFSLRKIGNPYENSVLYDLYVKNKNL